jgi:hypothetical protein
LRAFALAHGCAHAAVRSHPTRPQASEAWERSAAAATEVETAMTDCLASSRALLAVLAVAAVSGGHGNLDAVLQEGTAALTAIGRIPS